MSLQSDLHTLHASEVAAAKEYAPLYDRAYETPFWVSERSEFVRRVAAYASKHDTSLCDARILDIGTGTGSILVQLHARGARLLTGLDLSPEMLAIATEKLPGADLRLGAAEELDLGESSFDVITGFSVLHHLADLGLFFKRLEKVLSDGGIFAFSDPNAKSLLLRRRLRWLVWTAIYPIHKPLRVRNRAALEQVPSMEEERYYSPVHRALTSDEILTSLPANLEARVSSHGLIAPSFNNALVGGRLDDLILRASRLADRVLPFEGDALVTLGRRVGRNGYSAFRS